jgi:hypothetical protein
MLGEWVLQSQVGDTRYTFQDDGKFALEVDSVMGTDTVHVDGTFSLGDHHKLTLDYEQQGVAIHSIETIHVSDTSLKIGAVLVQRDPTGEIEGTWESWRTNQTGDDASHVTRTIEISAGGSGTMTTLLQRVSRGAQEEPETSTGAISWAGEDPVYTLSGSLDGEYTRFGDQLVDLQGAFLRP